jgi:glycosyltransferase involved in cell wall biosynthesis
MRILIVSQYFWPENFRINDLAAELAGRGHSVTVLTGLPNYPGGQVFAEYESDPQRFREFHGADVIRVPLIPRGKSRVQLALNFASFAISATVVGAWRLRGRRFDAIFVFAPSPITVGLPGVILGMLKKTPVVLWVLDQWPETLQAVGAVKSRLILRGVGSFVSFIYRRCNVILGQSRGFVSQIRRYAGPRPAVEYFPNWSDVAPDFDHVDAAPEVPALPGVLTVLFAGNIGDAQDFPAILEAAEILKDRDDVRWIVVGDGHRADWVAGEVQRRGLARRMSLLGRFPLERMPSFFKSAGALLVSLRPDPVFALTIPGKVQSYLAAGRPLVGMMDGEGAELIARSDAGLVCNAGDARGLAGILVTLAEAPETERALMGIRAKQLYESEFERDRQISRLEALLSSLRASSQS